MRYDLCTSYVGIQFHLINYIVPLKKKSVLADGFGLLASIVCWCSGIYSELAFDKVQHLECAGLPHSIA